MTTFKDFFEDWVDYHEGYYLISSESYTKEQAIEKLQEEILHYARHQGKKVSVEDLKEEWVSFRGGWAWEDEEFENGWWTGATGKRARKCWRIDL